MEIQLGDYVLPINIIRKNNKNIYFRIKEDGVLYVTCNRFVRESEILRTIKNNEASFIRMYKKMMVKRNNHEIFTYLGKPYTIIFNEDLKETIISDSVIYSRDQKMFDKWYKEECKRVFSERIVEIVEQFYNIPPFSLRVRKMTSRWGVNNISKKIITLNSELLKKDVSLIDYVIVHELCHFYEANHSSKFWKQVSLKYPNYKEARKRLRVE